MARARPVFAVLALLAGCSNPDSDLPGPGLDRIQFPSALNFGPVPVRLEVLESIELVNRGSEEAQVVDVTPTTGGSSSDYAFRLRSLLPLRIPTGTPAALDFSFRAEQPVSQVSRDFVLTFEDGAQAALQLLARTEAALRVEPTVVDFGDVVVGRPKERFLTLRNLLNRSIPVYVQTEGGRARPRTTSGQGRFEIDSAVNEDGRLASAAPLGPRAVIEIPVRYVPDPSGTESDRASWTVGSCPELAPDCSTTVLLAGEPVPAPVTCVRLGEDDAVTELDFGNLNPPEVGQIDLDCQARGTAQLQTILAPSSDTGITVSFDPSLPSLPVLLVPGDSFELRVEFDPSGLATDELPRDTILELQLSDPTSELALTPVRIELVGGRGRPDLEGQPSSVDFATTRVGSPRTRRIEVVNVGLENLVGSVRIDADPQLSDVFRTSIEGETLEIQPGSGLRFDLIFDPGQPADSMVAELVIFTFPDDPRNPDLEWRVPLQGRAESLPPCQLEVSQDSLQFGPAAFGVVGRGFVSFRNAGTTECLVDGWELTPDLAPEFTLESVPDSARLPPGSSTTVEIGFEASRQTASGQLHQGVLEFYASTESEPQKSLPLSGSRSDAAPVPAPNWIDLRRSMASCNVQTFSGAILNPTTAPLSVQSLDVLGTDADAFEVTPQTPLPYVLASRNGRLGYSLKTLPGIDLSRRPTALLKVEFEDTNEPLYVPIVADAGPGRIRESFVQSDVSNTDILFVLPFHGDRGDEDAAALLEALAPHYSSLSSQLTPGAFRVGFVTGDNRVSLCGVGARAEPPNPEHDGGCGLLASGPVDAVEPRYAESYRTLSGTERAPDAGVLFDGQIRKPQPALPRLDPALEVAVQALSPQARTGWNAPIGRDEAHWHLVFVNSIDDGSAGSLAFYADLLRSVRGWSRRNDLSISALAGPLPDGCSSPSVGEVLPAERLRRMVEWVGGRAQNPCNTDGERQLEAVGEAASGGRRIFRLARLASPSSLQVAADGIDVPERDGPARNWSYDSTRGSLTFLATTLTAAGTRVDVEYEAECGTP